MCYCVTLVGAKRCTGVATHEYIRGGIPGSRWRAICERCLAIVKENASPLDHLRVRVIEIDDTDEQNRRRLVRQRW